MTRREKAQPRRPARKHPSPNPVRTSKFAQSLLHAWRKLKLPAAEVNTVVAVSGGADSVALLCALDELIKGKQLKIKLVVAHLNHKLRGKASDADARWVRSLASELGHPFASVSVDVKRRAAKCSDNLEQAARRIRYEFLAKTAKTNKAHLVLTAHTLDDQAETFLLNLLRGSGVEGLLAIEPTRSLEPGGDILLVRPMLSWAGRADTENYCREHSIDSRVDEMNLDEKFARVRVRRRLLPLLKSFNPRVVTRLARTIEILREDNTALHGAASRLLDLSLAHPEQTSRDSRATTLRTDLLRLAPPALRRRALRLWLEYNRGDLRRIESAHIIAIERLLSSPKSGRLIELPGGAKVSRKSGLVHFHAVKSRGRE